MKFVFKSECCNDADVFSGGIYRAGPHLWKIEIVVTCLLLCSCLASSAELREAPGHSPLFPEGLFIQNSSQFPHKRQVLAEPAKHVTDKLAVICIHGWNTPAHKQQELWSDLRRYLEKKAGLSDQNSAFYMLYYDWSRSIAENGMRCYDQLSRFPKDSRLLLIGHSMGGLVARSAIEENWVKRSNYKVPYLITLGTPHHGTPAACSSWIDWSVPELARWRAEHPTLDGVFLGDLHEDEVGTRNLGYDDSDDVMPKSATGLTQEHVNDYQTRFIAELNRERNELEKLAPDLITRSCFMGGYLTGVELPDESSRIKDLRQAATSRSGMYGATAMLISRFLKSGTGKALDLAATDGIVPLNSSLFLEVGEMSAILDGESVVLDEQSIRTRTRPGLSIRIFRGLNHSQLVMSGDALEAVAERVRDWGLNVPGTNVIRPPIIPSNTALLVCLDRSSSMSEVSEDGRSKWDGAVGATKSLLDMLRGEASAYGSATLADLVLFNDALETLHEPTTNYDEIDEAISKSSPAGGTNIYEAIRRGLDTLKGSGEDTWRKAIILLSDGDQTTGTLPPTDPELLQEANDSGVAIYTVGLGRPGGSGYNEQVLQQISAETGGEFFPARDKFLLQTRFISVRHKSVGNALLSQTSFASQPGQIQLGSFDPSRSPQAMRVRPGLAVAQVKEGDTSLLVTLLFEQGAMRLLLKDPLGVLVDEKYPETTIISGSPNLIVVKHPMAGTWTASLDVQAVPSSGSRYDVQISGRAEVFGGGGGGGSSGADPLAPAVGFMGLLVVALGGRYAWIRRAARRAPRPYRRWLAPTSPSDLRMQ